MPRLWSLSGCATLLYSDASTAHLGAVGGTATIVGVQARRDVGTTMIHIYVLNHQGVGVRGQNRPAARSGDDRNSEALLLRNIPGPDIPGRLELADGAKFASYQAWSLLRLIPPAVLPCEARSIVRDRPVCGITSSAP